MDIRSILKKSRDGCGLSEAELVYLLALSPDSVETYMVLAEANSISRTLSDGKAEVHAQFAVNLGPCNSNCLFCSFAKVNGVFSNATELNPDQAVSYARQFEIEGANAIFMMSTARYPFGRFLEISKEVRSNLKSETTLVANIGDQSLKDALKLKDAGFAGVYHAVRLREGIDTALQVTQRKESIINFKEAGLEVGTCVEPVGPEHTNEELASMIAFTASFNPAYSGAARRIPIPGTEIARRGIISELRMAQIVAVTRLGMPHSVIGNCTHEPCTLGAMGGANLFWAEVGANPRDTEAQTEEGRGETVNSCREIFRETDWDIWQGPSRYYNRDYSPSNHGFEPDRYEAFAP